MDRESLEHAHSSAELRELGLPRGQTRSQTWRHPFRGVARVGEIDRLDPIARVVDVLPLTDGRAALGGWAACRWQGVRLLDGRNRYDVPVPLSVHPLTGQLRKRPGLSVNRRAVHPYELTRFDDVCVTTLPRAAYDSALDACDVMEALVAIEMVVSTVVDQSRTSLASVRQVYDQHAKTRGRVQTKRALEIASTRSASPWETRTRAFAIVEAGIEGWLVNQPLFDAVGRLLGIADMLEPRSGLVLESDGAGHRDEQQHSDDNVREERFERHNLTVVRVSAIDHQDADLLRARIQAGHRAGLSRNVARDDWHVVPPPWWWSWEPAARWR